MAWVRIVTVAAMTVFVLCPAALAAGNLVHHGDFSQRNEGWEGLGESEKGGASVIEAEGSHALRLVRKEAKAAVSVSQNLRLQPQTLYRLSVTGHGKLPAVVRLRPKSSADKDFATLIKPWAVTSAPMAESEGPVTSELVFDSGLKADSTALMLFLGDPEKLGEYVIDKVSLVEAGSSKPDKDETVVLHLGDSITITSYLPFEQRVDAVLAKLLEKELPGRKIRQINMGVDGEYVQELLGSGRYRSVIKENYAKVDVAIIRYGANDSRHGSPEEFKKQLAGLCEQLQGDYPGIVLVLGTGPYIKGNAAVNKQYAGYWQASRDLAAERKIGLVDVSARFEQEQSDKLTRSVNDQHPSAEGVRVMAEAMVPVVKEALGKAGQR